MKNVSITNYQSIKSADVELHPGVNVLLGPSDVGKSAFLRAIRDCCFNATGTGFIRIGGKKCTVTVDHVQWEKAKTVNRYSLVDGTVFDKVGRSVPEEISDELGIRDVEFGKGISRRLQFAAQLDPHFIIAENPADNAKVLGSLADLHAVYNGIREGERRLQNLNGVAEGARKDIETREADLEEREPQRAAAEAEAKKAEGLVARFEQRLVEYESLEAHRGALRTLRTDLEGLKEQIRPVGLEKIEIVGGVLVRLEATYGRLERLRGALEDLGAQRRAVNFAPIEALSERLVGLMRVRDEIARLRGDTVALEKTSGEIEAKRTKIEEKLAAIDICPLCKQPAKGIFSCSDS